MKKEVICPTGYPYILYHTVNQKKIVGVGSTEQQVYTKYQIHRKTKIKPVSITELIEQNGHTDAHKILKQYGERWVVARGNIFYDKMA